MNLESGKHLLVAGIASSFLVSSTPLPNIPYVGAGAVVTAGQLTATYMLDGMYVPELESLIDQLAYNSFTAPLVAAVLPLGMINSTIGAFVPSIISTGVTNGILTVTCEVMRETLQNSGNYTAQGIANPVSWVRQLLW